MKLISLEMLQHFKAKLDELFVKKELKTGSTTEYKQLSDNNLTDELVTKINSAGVATEVTENIETAKTEAVTESKAYTDEAKTAAIESSNSYTDTEVAEALSDAKSHADQAEADAVATAKSYTEEQVGAAKTELSEAISTATTDMATQTWATEQIETATDDMATNASVDEKIAEAKSYADTAEADAVSTAKSYADEQVAAAKTELNTAIKTQISTAYKVKGSTAFASLPALSADEEGNVYNVTDAFTTNANFVEGASKKYPAGSNVVCIEESEGVFKWDVLAGFIDTDTFVKVTDIETVTESEIDAMFAA